jgi:hypothetical protein
MLVKTSRSSFPLGESDNDRLLGTVDTSFCKLHSARTTTSVTHPRGEMYNNSSLYFLRVENL